MLNPKINYISYVDLLSAILKGLPQIPRDIDIIVGIPRSGMIPAYAIALYLNLPVMDLGTFLENRPSEHGSTRKPGTENRAPSQARRILLVDDSFDTGLSLENAKNRINKSGWQGTMTTCAIIVTPKAQKKVDINFLQVDMPRVFEWNLFHHNILKNACLDFDGVLCVDPTDEENDDGDRYKHFLRTAKPLFLPTQDVGFIVSSRLEKYTNETKAWLEHHNVKWRQLHLLALESKKERMHTQAHHKHKIDYYQKTNASLFIESDLQQAILIAKETGMPVFCTNTMQMINSDTVHIKAASFFLKGKARRWLGCLWRALTARLSGKRKEGLSKKIRSLLRRYS